MGLCFLYILVIFQMSSEKLSLFDDFRMVHPYGRRSSQKLRTYRPWIWSGSQSVLSERMGTTWCRRDAWWTQRGRWYTATLKTSRFYPQNQGWLRRSRNITEELRNSKESASNIRTPWPWVSWSPAMVILAAKLSKKWRRYSRNWRRSIFQIWHFQRNNLKRIYGYWSQKMKIKDAA